MTHDHNRHEVRDLFVAAAIGFLFVAAFRWMFSRRRNPDRDAGLFLLSLVLPPALLLIALDRGAPSRPGPGLPRLQEEDALGALPRHLLISARQRRPLQRVFIT